MLVEIVQLYQTVKVGKENKKIKESCFEWVYLLSKNIQNMEDNYEQGLERHLVYEKDGKKYLGINSVINYALTMYSTLDQSNIVSLLEIFEGDG